MADRNSKILKDEKTGRFLPGTAQGPGPDSGIKYKPEYDEQAYKLCLLGAIDKDLADFFNVCEDTIHNWVDRYDSFADHRSRGKMMADATVAQSLYKNACGYSHADVHISNHMGEITVTDITKHYPPNATSGIFWLKNRQRKLWKDKHEVDVTGDLSITQLLDKIDGKHTGLPPDEPE